MLLKKFTFYNLGRQLDDLAPGFGLTVDYNILEELIRSAVADHPPDHLRDELTDLALNHHCDFTDWTDHRFVHFVKHTH